MIKSIHAKLAFLTKDETIILLEFLLFSLIIRVLLFHLQGYKEDLAAFSAWFNAAAEYGPQVFYNAIWCDYPPFNVYIFWIFGSIAKWLSLFGTSSFVYSLKMPSTLFDVAISLLIYIFLRRKLDFKTSLVTSLLYAFNPATIFNTSVWGQYDAIYTFFLVLSIVAIVNSKPKLSVIAYTIGVLTKPQSIALAPLIIFLIVKKDGWRGIITAASVSAVTILVVVMPLTQGNPVSLLVSVYLLGYGNYPYTSLYAFNIWTYVGFWKPDTNPLLFLNFSTIGWMMFGILIVFILNELSRKNNCSKEMLVFLSAFVLLFGFFMLPTRIHERYLFPVFSFLVLMLPFIRKTLLIYGILTFTYLLNLVSVLRGGIALNYDPLAWTAASVNLIVFLYALQIIKKEMSK
ncbi:MAG: hypothetical protein QXX08_04805 [Candidatus Bathyarchaeia archaeon]